MKVLLILLVIILIFLYLTKSKLKPEEFTSDGFEENFNPEYFFKNFRILKRENNLQDDFKLDNNFYQPYESVILNQDIYKHHIFLENRSMQTLKFINHFKPNFKLTFEIPDSLDDCYLRYTITNKSLENNPVSYSNFLFYKFLKMSEQIDNIKEGSDPNVVNLEKYYYFIESGNEENYSNHDGNPLLYEYPLRLEGDVRDDENNLELDMFLFFFKYELKIDCYVPANKQVDLKQIEIEYKCVPIQEKIKIEDANIQKIDEKDVNLKIGYNYLTKLYDGFITQMSNDELVSTGFSNTQPISINSRLLFIFVSYQEDEIFYGRKIELFYQIFIFFIEQNIKDCLERKVNSSELNEEDIKILSDLVVDILYKPSNRYENYESYIITTKGSDEETINSESGSSDNKEEFLKLTKPMAFQIIEKFKGLSEGVRNKIQSIGKENETEIIDYSKYINKNTGMPTNAGPGTDTAQPMDMAQPMDTGGSTNPESEKNKIQERLENIGFILNDSLKTPQKMTHYTITTEFDISSIKTDLEKVEEEVKEVTEEEKIQQLLEKLTVKQKILYYIQPDIRKSLRNRNESFYDVNKEYTSNELKEFINNLREESKDKVDINKAKTAKENLKFVQLIIEGINTRDVEIINLIIKFKVTDNVNALINSLNNKIYETFESSNKYIGTFKNNILKHKHQDFKKNMDDIYNRFQDIKMKVNKNLEDYENEKIMENFASGIPHQHSPTGQINFLRNIPNVKPSDFGDSEWLRVDANKRLLDTYQELKPRFLTEGVKKGIMKEMNDMESALNDLNSFTKKNLAESREKLLLIEAKANEEANLKMAEENMTELERQMRDFNLKEKEQETKMKRMNEKLDMLEKENKGLNLSRFDNINSVRSLGDGQILSVIPQDSGDYQLLANGGCLAQQKDKNGIQLNITDCKNDKSQKFKFHHINNYQEYNKHLGAPINEFQEVAYPFHLITPTNDMKKCVSIKGNRTSMVECQDSKYHRFETLLNIKKCDSKYSN